MEAMNSGTPYGLVLDVLAQQGLRRRGIINWRKWICVMIGWKGRRTASCCLYSPVSIIDSVSCKELGLSSEGAKKANFLC